MPNLRPCTRFFVERVIALTGFGSPRTSRAAILNHSSGEAPKAKPTYTTSSIYRLAAHINHACVSNSRRSFIGNTQIVRATRDLAPDTELTFTYLPPSEYDSYAETQKALQNWGFACACPLCLARKATPSTSLARRKALAGDLKRAMGTSHAAPINIAKARKIVEQTEQTYTSAERAPGAVRLESWDPYIALGRALLSSDRPSEAVEFTVRGLEALGFVIFANPPRKGPAGAQGPELRVLQWGLANKFCIDAFLTLFRAYKIVAPQLVATAKEFVGVAYSVVVGERDTLLDTYPELR